MIVIIEGPDLAGKSLLFNELKINTDLCLSFNFVELGGFSSELFEHIEELQLRDYQIITSMISRKVNYIFDRFLVSAIVYDKLFNRSTKFRDTRRLLEQASFIHINYDFDKRDFSLIDLDLIFNLDQVKKISQAYKEYFSLKENRGTNYLYLDTTEIKPFDLSFVSSWIWKISR